MLKAGVPVKELGKANVKHCLPIWLNNPWSKDCIHVLGVRMKVLDSYKFTIERGGMGEISNEGSLGKVRILLGVVWKSFKNKGKEENFFICNKYTLI